MVVSHGSRFPGDELLHEGEPDSHADTAVDLPLNIQRVDRPSHVVGGHDLRHRHFSRVDVHRNEGEVGGEGIGGIRDPLSGLSVKRSRLGIEVPLPD